MKRVLSTLALGAVTLGSLAVAPSSVSAAPGDKTETALTSMIPTSPANMRAVRIVRLNRTGEFLVFGRDLSDTSSKWHMWQLKPDHTIDATFGTSGVVDLGVTHTTTLQRRNLRTPPLVRRTLTGIKLQRSESRLTTVQPQRLQHAVRQH